MEFQAIVGLAGFAAMLVMILAGIPIFVTLLSVTFVGMLILEGGDLTMVFQQFKTAPYARAADYSFAVLPLFMLLGVLAGETGVGRNSYDAIARWTNRMPGGLLAATIGGNAVFGAVSGMSLAANMVFAKIALPELTRAGYDKRLSMATIVASGCLDNLIPPSMAIIIFCVLVQNLSLGRALMCGIGPALLLMVLLYGVVLVQYWLHPERVPRAGAVRYTWRERMASLKFLLPVAAFFVLVIGGTFWGVFSATVAGAIGSVILIVYGLIRRVALKKILRAMWEACVMNAGIFPIVIAGTMFSRFISLSRLPFHLTEWFQSLNMPGYVVFLIVLIFYVFCGCIMDIASVIIITIPVVFPLLVDGFGFDPYMLVIVLVFVGEMAGLTPPIGMNVFATASALKVDPGEIFRGVWPFVAVEFATALVIGAFPVLVTWLPDLLG
ncbi:MAG: TRAP transporter large permease [Thermoleophilia bacterium]|nr:TRAP transporter large permease [Thermoleophilia bacterium]